MIEVGDAGGQPVGPGDAGQLPANVYLGGSLPNGSDADRLTRRWYDGTAAAAGQDLPTGGIAWQQVRGAMVVDGDLVYGTTDGKLHRRPFDGSAYGLDKVVDPYNDPYWSNVKTGSGISVYRGALPAFYGELPNVTAMTYRNGRLYYTLSGRSALYYRAFTPESGIVGGQRYEVPGAALPEVNGLVLSGNQLYFAARADGTLHRMSFAGGALTGPSTAVSGPTLDGADWRARAVFLGPGRQPGGAEQPVDSPVAFRDVDSKNVNAIRPRVAVPEGVSPGDGLVLFVTVNAAGATMSQPAGVTGWQRIGDLKSGTCGPTSTSGSPPGTSTDAT